MLHPPPVLAVPLGHVGNDTLPDHSYSVGERPWGHVGICSRACPLQPLPCIPACRELGAACYVQGTELTNLGRISPKNLCTLDSKLRSVFGGQLNVTRAMYVTMDPDTPKAQDQLKILRNLVRSLLLSSHPLLLSSLPLTSSHFPSLPLTCTHLFRAPTLLPSPQYHSTRALSIHSESLSDHMKSPVWPLTSAASYIPHEALPPQPPQEAPLESAACLEKKTLSATLFRIPDPSCTAQLLTRLVQPKP